MDLLKEVVNRLNEMYFDSYVKKEDILLIVYKPELSVDINFMRVHVYIKLYNVRITVETNIHLKLSYINYKPWDIIYVNSDLVHKMNYIDIKYDNDQVESIVKFNKELIVKTEQSGIYYYVSSEYDLIEDYTNKNLNLIEEL